MAALEDNIALTLADTRARGLLKVAASSVVYRGALLERSAAGFVNGTPASTPDPFAGIADEYADNSSGANGDKKVAVIEEGILRAVTVAGSGSSAAGDTVYAASDNVADLTITSTGNQAIGVLHGNQTGSTTWDVFFQAAGRRSV